MIHYSRRDEEILCGSDVPGGRARYADEVECLDCLRLLVAEGQAKNKRLREELGSLWAEVSLAVMAIEEGRLDEALDHLRENILGGGANGDAALRGEEAR